MPSCFHNRTDAGRRLARALHGYAGCKDVVVLALPRGGVPVGHQVARALEVPLDIFIVRKLGVPGYQELAMGAIASGGVQVLNDSVVHHLSDASASIESAVEREQQEIQRRETLYREGRAVSDLKGKTVILVDDGLATGATMRAAVRALRQRQLGKLIVAVPVGAPETCASFQGEADEVVCLLQPVDFRAVGQFYEDFTQTTDDEVRELLARAAPERISV